MADYPTTKLEKALARRGAATTARPAWQELMARHDTVPASKAIQAPDALSGFSGSWAGSYELSGAIRDVDVAESPPQVQRRTNRLGQPGMGEINFRPYDHNTSRHGKYGPSLLGHPVSFQVIGPTAKSHLLIHQWYVTEVGGADVLTLDPVTIYSTAGTPAALPATLDTLLEIYGLASIPDEGLYVLISETGSEGVLTDNGDGLAGTVGGLGDGIFGTGAAPPPGGGVRTALIPLTESSKYEIFRVVSAIGDSLTLDAGKRLEDHFTLNIAGETPIIRAITLLRPAAARVVAVPGSGNKTFAFVPPETSLNADYMPPFYMWTTAGTFDPWVSGPGLESNPAYGFRGAAADYAQETALPIPVPITRGAGRLAGINGEAILDHGCGRIEIVVDAGEHFEVLTDIGKVIRIYDIRRENDGTWVQSTEGADIPGDAEMDRLLGYFEIVDTNLTRTSYIVRWISQFDPNTGVPFYGSSFLTRMATGSAAGQQVNLKYTLHDPVSALWTDKYLHPTRLDATRLQNIINPSWVEPTMKSRTITEMDGHPALPDKAAFDTSSSNGGAPGSNANPGSMLDLGFRPVFFPARVDTGTATLVPDFDNPIESNELLLDSTQVSQQQFLEVDYSAGLVQLSHAPVGINQLVRDASILTTSDNPRGEVVFFASFVPFSQEPGQAGPNPRVTAGRTLGRVGDWCLGELAEPADAYGSRTYWPAATQTLNSGQEVAAAATRGIINLDTALTPVDLPPAGFVEVLIGDNTPHGLPIHTNTAEERHATFGYSAVDYVDAGNGNNTTLFGTFGGAFPAATYAVEPGVTPATVVLRRNIIMPNTVDGRAGTDYQHDTTYGVAKRASAMRFKFGAMTPEADGSVLVHVEDPRTDAHERLFADLFSSWCLSGGVMETAVPTSGAVLHFTELTVLIDGIRTILPEQEITAGVLPGPPPDQYIYIDGTDPSCPVYATGTALPLPDDPTTPDPNHVLLGSYTHDGINVLTYTDLRNPLADIDKRLDITVGAPLGHAQPGDAHFNELADAVEFVSETMDPVASGKGGEMGRFRRIKVIGPTLEDNDKLPITPRDINGVIIEGAAWPIDGSESVPRGVTWEGDATALFDLSNCEGWVFRDLAFRYRQGTGAASDATIKNRTLFTVMSGSADDILFENIVLQGPAHGFLYFDDTTSPGSTDYDRITLTNCIASSLTDFAVFSADTTTVCTGMHIERCHFEVEDGAGRQTSEANLGIIDIRGAWHDETRVLHTHLLGGLVGIALYGYWIWIEDCYIEGTVLPGIWLADCSFGTIRSCDLYGVHSGAGALGPATPQKSGIYMGGVSGASFISVLNNRVGLDAGSAGDYAIYEDNLTGYTCWIVGNEVDRGIYADWDCSVRDNSLERGGISLGSSCVAEGNELHGAGYGLEVLGDSNRVGSNALRGDLSITGQYNHIINNTVGSDITAAGADNHITGNRVAGNLILDSTDNRIAGNYTGSILRDNDGGNQFSGNHFAYDGAVDHRCGQYSTFSGDWFGVLNDGSDGGTVLLTGGGIRFTGCVLADGFDDNGGQNDTRFVGCTIQSYAHQDFAGNNNQFVGNQFLEPGGGPFNLTLQGNNIVFSDNVCSHPLILSAADHILVSANTFRQEDSGYSLTVQSTCADVVVQGNSLRGGFLAGEPGTTPAYVNRLTFVNNQVDRGGTSTNLIVYADSAVIEGNWTDGGIGVQGAAPFVLNNRCTGTQSIIQWSGVTPGGIIVLQTSQGSKIVGNSTKEDFGFMGSGGGLALISGNTFGKRAIITQAPDTRILGNNFAAIVDLDGDDMIIKDNDFAADVSSGGVNGWTIPNAVISDNRFGASLLMDLGSDNVLIANNQVVGNITTARYVGGGTVVVQAGDDPQILGNRVGGHIICAAYDNTPVAGVDETEASNNPMIHNNRIIGDIVCSVRDSAGTGYVACSTPSIQGNIGTTAGGTEIYVAGDYMVIGNRATNIFVKAFGGAFADPTANGIMMGNKITTNIFNVAVAGSGWDKDSGADTGHLKVGNSS